MLVCQKMPILFDPAATGKWVCLVCSKCKLLLSDGGASGSGFRVDPYMGIDGYPYLFQSSRIEAAASIDCGADKIARY